MGNDNPATTINIIGADAGASAMLDEIAAKLQAIEERGKSASAAMDKVSAKSAPGAPPPPTPEEFRQLFPKASAEAIALNLAAQPKIAAAEAASVAAGEKKAATEAAVLAAKVKQAELDALEAKNLRAKETAVNRIISTLTRQGAREFGGGRLGGSLATGAETMLGIGGGAAAAIGATAVIAGAMISMSASAAEFNSEIQKWNRELEETDYRMAAMDKNGLLHAAHSITEKIRAQREALSDQVFDTDEAKAKHPFKYAAHAVFDTIDKLTSHLPPEDGGIDSRTGTQGTKQTASEENRVQAETEIAAQKILQEAATRNAIRLGYQEVEIARLHATGQDEAADKMERRLKMQREFNEIDKSKNLTADQKGELKDQIAALDKYQHMMHPGVGTGDSLTSAGGGGGVFNPQDDGGDSGYDLLAEKNQTMIELQTQMRDHLKEMAGKSGGAPQKTTPI